MVKYEDYALAVNAGGMTQPLRNASVTVARADNGLPASLYLDAAGTSAITALKTDNTGRVVFYTSPGDYVLTFSGAGFTTFQRVVNVYDEDADVMQVADYAALRAYTGQRQALHVTGYLATSAPSGIAGLFTLDPSDTTTADNGGTVIVASNGARWKRAISGPINVMWFGATGNGVTDDAAAIQSAINVARMSPALRPNGVTDPSSPYFSQTSGLFLPPGQYVVTVPLWFGINSASTGWDASKIVENVFGYGAVIVGRTNGKAVVDLSGAFGMKWHGVTIFGDKTQTPKVGILLARSGNAAGDNPSAGLHRFTDVNVHGDFTLACVYNYASEINNWINCFLYQNSGKTVYLATNNNARHAVTSAYCTLATTTQSAYGDFFTSCDLKSSTGNTTASGAVVYLESPDYGPSFLNCYLDTSGAVTMPCFYFCNGQGLNSGQAAAWTQSARIMGCTFEYRANQDIIAVDADHVVLDLTVRGNTMPIDYTNSSRMHINIAATGKIKNLDAQSTSGDTLGTPFIVGGAGTLLNQIMGVVPVSDTYVGTSWTLIESGLTRDGAWHTLDITGYGVPKTAKFIAVRLMAKTTAAGADNFMGLRGSSSDLAGKWVQVTPAVTAIEAYIEGLCPVSNGQIQYLVPANFNLARILIREYHV